MKKWKFKFGYPTKVELGFVVFSALCLIVLDYAQNMYQPSVAGGVAYWSSLTYFGLTALTTFWVFFFLYNVSLFIVYGRALRSRNTSYRFDIIFGILSFFGVILLLAGGIGAMYYSAESSLPFLLNFKQIDVYHTGILLQWIGILYFTLTS